MELLCGLGNILCVFGDWSVLLNRSEYLWDKKVKFKEMINKYKI